MLRVLTDRPSEADWLPADERDWLVQRMAAERTGSGTAHAALDALRNPRVLALGLVCFGAVIINYGLSFFLPQIVKGFGLSNGMVGSFRLSIRCGAVWHPCLRLHFRCDAESSADARAARSFSVQRVLPHPPSSMRRWPR